MPDPIIALSDGRPGHFSATAGMLEALAQVMDAELKRIEIRLRVKALRPALAAALRVISRLPRSLQAGAARLALAVAYRVDQPWPDRASAIVSTGGDTLYANALLGRVTGAPNLFCGSLRGADPGHFTHVITNRSADDPHAIPNAVVLETAPMPKPPARAPAKGLPYTVAVLVGGDGGGYRYDKADWQALADLIDAIDRRGFRILLTTSRRTSLEGEAVLAEAAARASHVDRAVFYNRRPERVMAEFIAEADAFVVTADSATMITEAVLAGRPVLLTAPAHAQTEARYRRFLDQLIRDRRATMLAPGEPFPTAEALARDFAPIETHPVDQLAEVLRSVWRTR